MSKKPVIVFEGIEGSGKSYHLNEVSKHLKKKKIDHIKIREPGGSQNSEKIRKLILNNKISFNKETDLFLIHCSRSFIPKRCHLCILLKSPVLVNRMPIKLTSGKLSLRY